ncbi:hypothetical protein Pint_02196 [Pistacia integerrima]|uniref:Uncharacterized protein n=1 Tax=Pistacia integerrima TaxID=434235 RepID=A0ACC0ZQ10_9ROSI|nr:hypothetical protein Pint_02196 [Pistacia integerrima]
MKRALPRHFSATLLQSQRKLLPFSPHNNGGLLQKLPKICPIPSFTSNPRRVFTNSLPPPEWIEPFNDVSDLLSSPGNLNPSPWVSQILNLLDGSMDMEANLDSFCQKFLIKLSPNFVSFVLRINDLRKKPDVAFRFFAWASKQKKYAHRLETYVSLIDCLSLSSDLDRVRLVFNDLRQKGFLMTVSGANSLIKSFGGLGMVEELLWVWRRMKENEKGIEIPPHAYGLVIGGLCKEGKCMEGYTVLESMIKKGCKPNVAIYTALIDSYAKHSSMNEAINLFERMKNKGLEPDQVTYGVIVSGLCKSGRLDEAMEYFEFCRGNGIAVNAMFYSNLIDGLGKAGRVDEAEEFFEEMVEKGCTRDSYCYNALIDALAKCGKIDEALAVFKRMEDEGCDQTVYTYTIIISGLFREHRNEEAIKLWDIMIDKGITPTAASFRALSIGLCLSGKVSRACRILDDLAPMGVIPETAFEDMINALCKAGRIKEACKLADGIVDRGREIPGRIRTLLINALRKSGNADLAMKLMHSKIGIGYNRMGSIKKRVKFRVLVES